MQRRLVVRVDGVDVAAQLQRELHALQRLRLGARILPGRMDAQSRGDHQQRRVVLVRHVGVGSQLQQHAHQGRVGQPRGHHEGRRADAVQGIPVPVPRLYGDSGVHVRAARHQLAHEVQAVEVAGGDGAGRVEPEVRPAYPGHLMQRRPALLGAVRVCALVRQEYTELPVRVGGGKHHRARPVGQPVVRIRTCRQQGLHGVDAARANGKEQRGEAVGRGTPVEAGALRIIGNERAGVDIGARVEEQLHGLRVALRRGPHEGCLSAALRRFEVGAARQQRFDRRNPAGTRRDHEHRLAGGRRRIRVGARGEQPVEHRPAAVNGREPQRGHAEGIGGGDIRSARQQQIRQLDVVHPCGPMERRASVGLLRVRIGAAI